MNTSGSIAVPRVTSSTALVDGVIDVRRNRAEHRVRRIWALARGLDEHEEWDITPADAAADPELVEALLCAAGVDGSAEHALTLRGLFEKQAGDAYLEVCDYLELDF